MQKSTIFPRRIRLAGVTNLKEGHMVGSIERRKFLAGTVAGVAALGSQASGNAGFIEKREFYELRVYKTANAENTQIMLVSVSVSI